MAIRNGDGNVSRILIVEDEALLALDLSQSLREFGYEVVGTAAKSAQALQLALLHTPDLVLMDINLPGGPDGIETYSQIRMHHDIPVVYLTGYSERDVLERAKRTEPYGYLSKPVSLGELRSTIETALYKHRADKQLRESESRLKLMVDSLPMGAVYREGDSIYLNKAAETIIGYSQDEITSFEDWFTTLFRSDAENARACYQKERDTGFPARRTVTLIRKDGISRSVSFAGYVYEGGDVWLMVDETEKSQAKEELRQREDLHRTTLANITDAIFVTDEAGTFVYVGPNIYMTFGYSAEEVERMGNIEKLITPRVFDPSQLRREQEIDNIERIIIDKYGQEHVLLISVKLVNIKGGTVLYTCRDITDRKKVENALRESEEKFRRIVQTANEGIWVMDSEFRTVFANPRLAQMLGCTVDEMNGRTVHSFMFEEDLPDHWKNMEIRRQGKDQTYERRFLKENGETLWAIVSTTALKDSEGNFAGSFGMLTDITERKKMEEELLEREGLIRFISDNLPSGMIYQVMRKKDGTRKFTYLSEKVRDFYGCSPEEAINEPELIYGRIHPDDKHRMFAKENQSRENLCDFSNEVRMIDPSGDIRWSYFTSSPRKLEDGSTSWNGLEIDITERKKAEGALRKSEQRFRDLYKGLRDGMAEVDESGRFVRCNPQYLDMLGYSFDELAELTYKDITPNRWHAMESRIGEELVDVRGYSDLYEKEYIHKNGTIFPVEFQTYRVRDSAGNGAGYWSFVRDITERKAVEAELRNGLLPSVRKCCTRLPQFDREVMGRCSSNHWICWSFRRGFPVKSSALSTCSRFAGLKDTFVRDVVVTGTVCTRPGGFISAVLANIRFPSPQGRSSTGRVLVW